MTPHVETYKQYPFTVATGDGARLRDTKGRSYWDLYGGHAVALLGHAHPAVVRALHEQARQLTFYSNVAPLEIRDRAAEAITQFAPPGLERVFFCNSGAEANENALKLAIQQTGRTTIAALERGFHGRTLLALSATASEKLRAPFADVLTPARRLQINDVDDLSQIDESVAAVIVEPILSIAGVIELTPEYLGALRQRCNDTGTLLVFDEIQTGMGRLGRPFAAGAHGVMPDLLTTAKGIANGFPMGAVLMTEEIGARVATDDLGSTFGGGPLACAALLAVLEAIAADSLLDRAAALGQHATEVLRRGPVTAIIGRGCMLGLQVNGSARPLWSNLLERGFVTGTSGDPSVLRLLPPINTPTEALDELGAALDDIGA